MTAPISRVHNEKPPRDGWWTQPAVIEAVHRPLNSASSLPGPFFSEPSVWDREFERIFVPSWHLIGREDELPKPGDFLTTDVAGSGVMIVRNGEGRLRAFHNVCRHRGTRILDADAGSGLRRFLCPYHAWTYDLDGRLKGTPHMADAAHFDRDEYGLHPVRLETWRGFMFVTLDESLGSVREQLAPLERRAAPYPLERLRRAHRVVYDVEANWKLVVQNANECYHCPGVHPQLVKLTPYRSGEEDLRRGPVFGGWMDFVRGVSTLSSTEGTPRASFPELSKDDRGRVYYYVLYPNNFLSLLPDYVTLDRFLPMGPGRTRVIFDLYVDRDEQDPGTDAMDFWDTTNRQDWHICELAHRGSRSVAYRQGRYSSEEEVVHMVDSFYLTRMGLVGADRGSSRRRGHPSVASKSKRRARRT
ncbi:MAG: aromatic ring-hydroxylating dioxygenase subunit alpha [Thermoplasmata archaeon]